jgi:hypothetical protein
MHLWNSWAAASAACTSCLSTAETARVPGSLALIQAPTLTRKRGVVLRWKAIWYSRSSVVSSTMSTLSRSLLVASCASMAHAASRPITTSRCMNQLESVSTASMPSSPECRKVRQADLMLSKMRWPLLRASDLPWYTWCALWACLMTYTSMPTAAMPVSRLTLVLRRHHRWYGQHKHMLRLHTRCISRSRVQFTLLYCLCAT